MNITQGKQKKLRSGIVMLIMFCFVSLQSGVAFAVDTTGPTGLTGAPENTGAPSCTGAGCDQGAGQGENQGTDQGGVGLEDLGAVEDDDGNLVLPDGVEDTRQGAGQGESQGEMQDVGSVIDSTNENTGTDSDNLVDSTIQSTEKVKIQNNATDQTNIDASAQTGDNENNKNTGTGATETGDAYIGVTQVKNDNTTAIDGGIGLNVEGYKGDIEGDFAITFDDMLAILAGDGELADSIRTINSITGENSTNDITTLIELEEILEVQNDGLIENKIDVEAVTGRNEASQNTGDGAITTGDASVSATLVNMLNTTVTNGNLLVSISDIFGDLYGNVILSNFNKISQLFKKNTPLTIDAENGNTGSNSTNNIDIDVTKKDILGVNNEVDITTEIDAEAITGRNEAAANTGGGLVETGDASISTSNTSIANTTIDGGNWGLVIVHSFNRAVGYLIGDLGEVRQVQLEDEENTIHAQNEDTGANSDNTIDIDINDKEEQDITNDAQIINDIHAKAITGENTTNQNTGQGSIATGKARIQATTVNIANTIVKNANLGIAVVNVLGDWFGEVLYDGEFMAARMLGGGDENVIIDAANSTTGSDSHNMIDIDIDHQKNTSITNKATVNTTLEATIDTGSNDVSRNTNGARITTGRGWLDMYSRTIVNMTGTGGSDGFSVDVQSTNEETGSESDNTIEVHVNDERVLDIDNDAFINTTLPVRISTGDNIASNNTFGGDITTGDADARAVIRNVVNKVLTAFNGVVDIDKSSQDVFGMLRNMIALISNTAAVQNIADMLFNTGGNISNNNTGSEPDSAAAHISQDNNTSQEPADNKAVVTEQDNSYEIEQLAYAAEENDISEEQKSYTDSGIMSPLPVIEHTSIQLPANAMLLQDIETILRPHTAQEIEALPLDNSIAVDDEYEELLPGQTTENNSHNKNTMDLQMVLVLSSISLIGLWKKSI